jgi:hypothetical protein
MANAAEVKEKLDRLYPAKEKYTVAFSGKKNGKVNGLYKPDRREIVIHDGNFENDSLLMYTAIHEMAHHVQHTEYGQNAGRSHTNLFWATFYDLADKAEEAGIYRPAIDGDTLKLIAEAKAISVEIARLQRELGAAITRLAAACKEKGLRAEDMIERRAQISRAGAAAAVAAHNMGDRGVAADIQEAAARERDGQKRAAILEAGKAGKSAAQAKRAGMSAGTATEAPEDETAALELEKRRIEKTIEGLSLRLQKIRAKLESLAGNGRERMTADARGRVPRGKR